MHPSVVLSFWLALVLLIQILPAMILAPVGVLAVLLCSAEVRRHFLVLLRRSRWILLTLSLTFVFLTPGERLWDTPINKEGLLSGGEHLLRLLSVLLALAWLVGGRSVEWLLSAMWGAMSLLRAEHGARFMVRLALTLRYSAESDKGRSWKTMLSVADTTPPAVIELAHVQMRLAERCLASGFLLAGLSAFLVLL